ncbi:MULTISPECIES: DUF4189 domain-containing protein [Xanthomonas]|uniref:DUF4189 domain-containing protein n=1 Tax=Xanthomonas TaxID=338 RepID=UPI00126469EA|nr:MULTISPECIES: DUF4189 domain-containing protein [Xanthomonas]KAB7761920.1 hypothetical protein CEK68_20210 [Xanthomonas sp. LMG 12461]
MKYMVCFTFLFMLSSKALAEQGCPPGQLPAQASGNIASCGPIPPGYYQQQPSPPAPSGKWIKTWGAIAIGTVDSVPYYGVPTGAMSESEAKSQALARCAKKGAQNCKVVLVYKNQCAAIVEPQINGRPNPDGFIQFSNGPTKEKVVGTASEGCERKNPGAACKVIYQACSEPVFERY